MHSILSEFELEIQKIRDYVESNRQIQDILTYSPQSADSPNIVSLLDIAKQHLTTFRSKKIFEYRALIISLYGCFERYVETIIMGYLSHLNDIIPNYRDLPETIRNNHFQLSATLLNNLSQKKYENVTTKELIVENLHKCAIDDDYKLNIHAYIDHKANLKHEVIYDLISHLAILDFSGKMKRSECIINYFDSEFIIDENTRIDVIFGKLEDLAQLRNDISHGTPGQHVLHPSVIIDYINYVEAYGKSMYFVLENEGLKFRQLFRSEVLGAVIKIINNHILCVTVENKRIAVGDQIICVAGKDHNPIYYEARVEEIQIKNVKHDMILIYEPTAVALRLSKSVKINYTFYSYRNNSAVQISMAL